jgi:hypothetical protein
MNFTSDIKLLINDISTSRHTNYFTCVLSRVMYFVFYKNKLYI